MKRNRLFWSVRHCVMIVLIASIAGPFSVNAQFPPATLRLVGQTFPAAGGAYFRNLPYGLVRAELRSAEKRGVPGTFYVHPWEWDPGQPHLDVPVLTRIRHYGGQRWAFGRIERSLGEFRFDAIR